MPRFVRDPELVIFLSKATVRCGEGQTGMVPCIADSPCLRQISISRADRTDRQAKMLL